MSRTFLLCALAALLLAALWAAAPEKPSQAAIHFLYRPIDFRLDSSETLRRYAPETMAGGVAAFDYDNDGNTDVFFVNGANILTLKKDSPKFSDKLFRNDGNGHFTDVTAQAGLAGVGFDYGVAIGDYDNDGYEDIFVGGLHADRLYHNNGDGTFTNVTVKAGLNKPDPEYGPLWSVGGAWFDANNDGLLDLFVLNYLAWDPAKEPRCEGKPGKLDYCHPKFYGPTPNQLFLNNGDGTFRDASAESGIRAHPAKAMGIGLADFDLDGWMDVFVSNDKVYNSYFHNLGGGKFEEIAFKAGLALAEDGQFISGMGVDARDIDNDGYPDIAFVALENETFPLFRNAGKRGFIDVTQRSGMARVSMSMAGYSPNLADFDNDGWKDLFVSRGHVQALGYGDNVRVEQHSTVFRNLGGFNFQPLTEEAGFTALAPSRHRGAAVADFNNDGRLDVVVSAIAAPAEIWINDSPGAAHWLAFQLQGVKSNRDAIGARIKVVAGGATQYNHVSFAGGYGASSATPTHFGLGPNKSADLVEIRWPSGIVQELKNVAAGQVLRIKEPPK
jgi:hypothetical protein